MYFLVYRPWVVSRREKRTFKLGVLFTICAIALVAEALVGYPSALFNAIGHPVTWIGAALDRLDRRWNLDADTPSSRRRWGGMALAAVLAGCGLAGAAVTGFCLAALPPSLAMLVLGLLTSTCLAQRSLDTHIRAVADALDHQGIEAAREAVGAVVGRETESLDEGGVARAAIESLAENFADGVVAPIFWLAWLGPPGCLVYKAINTADSMIGHRTPRHEAFGFYAAKLDDLVNWPAARLAALWIVLGAAIVPGASWRDAWRVMRRDAGVHLSPNAGWPEAAMAGALGVRLGGPRAYAGKQVDGATIGDGEHRVRADTIRMALRIYRTACGLEIAAILILAFVTLRWR